MMQCPELTESERLSIHPDNILAWWIENCQEACPCLSDKDSDSIHEQREERDDDTIDL
jgi:hypothetical protein